MTFVLSQISCEDDGTWSFSGSHIRCNPKVDEEHSSSRESLLDDIDQNEKSEIPRSRNLARSDRIHPDRVFVSSPENFEDAKKRCKCKVKIFQLKLSFFLQTSFIILILLTNLIDT